MVLRAEDVSAMLTDPRTKQIAGADYVRLNQMPDSVSSRFIADFFLFDEDEAHRTKRGLFARTFSHAAMRAARAEIRATADEIIAAAPPGESFDFVDQIAARVPAEMIAAILGLPKSEASYFAGRVYDLALALSPPYPHADHGRIETAAVDLISYVEGHMRARMEEPCDDLLTNLMAGWRREPLISFESLVRQVVGVIIGGSDTTRAGFGMLIALLLQRPEHWAAVKADPSLIPGAVSEGMRFDPSVGSFARFTTAPVEIGGFSLPAGVMLRLSTLSALRDPEVYEEPDQFDIRRADHPRLHPVFGGGPHRCLGEMLARLEMEEGLAALIAAAPDIELVEAPRLLGFGGVRQITPMRVRIP